MSRNTTVRLIVGVIFIGMGIFFAGSLLSYSPFEGPIADYPSSESTNFCGVVGTWISCYAFLLLGWSSLGIALSFVLTGAYLLYGLSLNEWGGKVIGMLLALTSITLGLGAIHLPEENAAWGMKDISSGILGDMFAEWVHTKVGWGGLTGLTATGLLGAVILLGGGNLLNYAAKLAGILVFRPVMLIVKALQSLVTKPSGNSTAAATAQKYPNRAAKNGGVESQPTPSTEPERKAEKKRKKRQPEIVHPRRPTSPKGVSGNAAIDNQKLSSGSDSFMLPPVSLLQTVDSEKYEEDEEAIRERGEILEQTLNEFGIDAEVVRVQRGPVVTMYEMALAAGTKVSKVESLADDLAIALKAPNVRVVAPLPGKSTIGIEVPNARREVVGIRELIEHMDKDAAQMDIPLFLGKDTAGNPLIVDLAMAPHLLIAGATGSGKSVSINTIISSILMTRRPGDVQMLLVDPKSVEFTDYKGLPHLICPILTDMKKAAGVLQWACKKMDDRFSLLSRTGVRNIGQYNRLGKKEIIRRLDPEEDAEVDDVPFYMPHIVIVIDELGELMMVAAKEVESSIIRLSQKARAVGIHLICATQRPSADVITGLIKANLPARIAFQVSSKVNSRVILDRNGAELLLGQGDMLMLPPGSSRVVRAQGTYVSQQETQKLVAFLAEQGEPHFKKELREYNAAQDQGSAQDDELYDEAVRIILETQRGSVSLLQRRLAIGYSRAARLIDMMAEAGIVGPHKGSQAREVMLTLEEWENARSGA
jgi:S-DNA-T family DNA segregation ATPase FtsK/SpoIIIE